MAIFDAYAVWCGPCKAIAPKIVELSNKYTNAKFYKIDVDELPDGEFEKANPRCHAHWLTYFTIVAQELGIRAMPTFIVFKDGEKVKEVVGADARAVETAVVDNLK